jgi:hypothetical protein
MSATTKITGLTAHNVRALREVLHEQVEAGELELTSSTATWHTDAVKAYRTLWWHMNSGAWPRRGHPLASLHAVARKLRRVGEEQALRGEAQQHDATEAGAAPAEGGGPMATEQQAPKRQRGQAPTSLKAATDAMAKNKAAFDAYEAARLERKALEGGEQNSRWAELTAVMDKHREGFTVYWRAYNSEPAKGKRLKDREARKAKAEAAAKKKAAKGKAAEAEQG